MGFYDDKSLHSINKRNFLFCWSKDPAASS